MEQRKVIWKLIDNYDHVVDVAPGQKFVFGRSDCNVVLKVSGDSIFELIFALIAN